MKTKLENPSIVSENLVHPYTTMYKANTIEGALAFRQDFRMYLNDFIVQKFDDYEVDPLIELVGESIQVPSCLELKGQSIAQYVNQQYPFDGLEDIKPPYLPKNNEIFIYETKFNYQKAHTAYLVFDGVLSSYECYLNGKYVGFKTDSFTKGSFDVTDLLVEGENVLRVKVVKFSTWLEDQDFYRLSGIFRPVYIESYKEIFLKDFVVNYDLIDYCQANIEVVAQTNNDIDLVYHLYDYNNQHLITSTEPKFTCDVQLWSAENPNLYKLVIQTGDEYSSMHIGFREYKLDKYMMINNKRIEIKGVNRHEFSNLHGFSVTYEETLKDIINIKNSNMNAIRTSHYPNAEFFYRLCDEYGLYVMDEANLETHGTWQHADGMRLRDMTIPDNRPEYLTPLLFRIDNMFYRDRNHASIIMWSLGNESYGGENLLKAYQYFKSLDASRLIHYEGDFNDNRFVLSDMKSTMYQSVSAIQEYLEENRDRPYILCEYSHAMGNSNGAHHKYTDLMRDEPLFQGGYIWDYIDQELYINGVNNFGGRLFDRPTDYNFCANGLVYSNRENSPKMAEIKHNYSSIIIKIEEKSFSIENDFLFTNLNKFKFIVKKYANGELYASEEFRVDLEPACTYLGSFELNGVKNETVAIECYLEDHHIVTKSKTYEETFYQPQVSTLKLIEGNFNYGYQDNNFRFVFDKVRGSISSIKYGEVEYILNYTDTIKPLFTRALNDNDRGNLAHYFANLNTMMLSYARPLEVKYEEDTIISKLLLGDNKTIVHEYIKVYEDYTIEITLDYKAQEHLHEFYSFGYCFDTLKMDTCGYYGLGPQENYQDRKEGANLGIYEYEIKENLAKYVMPSECGNREGNHEVTIRNAQGQLVFRSNEAFSFSALEHNHKELQNAFYLEDLKTSNKTSINICKAKAGVGGDDSWGALAHEEYRLKANQDYRFTFFINNK